MVPDSAPDRRCLEGGAAISHWLVEAFQLRYCPELVG